MSFGLTPPMQRCLDFIRDYILEKGRPPSFAEIGQALGVTSRGYIHRLICALEERGALVRLPGRSRSIRLLPASPALSVTLPENLMAAVQAVANKTKVTPEQVVIEAVREGFAALRSNVSRETSKAA